MLNYNGSKPSRLKKSVELDEQISLKQFFVIFNFLETVLVSFEAEIRIVSSDTSERQSFTKTITRKTSP